MTDPLKYAFRVKHLAVDAEIGRSAEMLPASKLFKAYFFSRNFKALKLSDSQTETHHLQS